MHPVVLFTITDAFIRRNKGQERVIGTLLGTISDGVVEVKNCYAVPHSEANEQVGGGSGGGTGRPCFIWRGTSRCICLATNSMQHCRRAEACGCFAGRRQRCP